MREENAGRFAGEESGSGFSHKDLRNTDTLMSAAGSHSVPSKNSNILSAM